jgi:hypothetical protein
MIKPFINAKQNEKKQETDRQNRQYCKKVPNQEIMHESMLGTYN